MYTNNAALPLAVAVWLAHDEYDHVQEVEAISATTLLKSVKQVVLSSRVAAGTTDIANLIQSRIGTAIHSAIENAWKVPKNPLELLGYPPGVVSQLKVNPSLEELLEGCIPIYMEQRGYKEINGFTISGKFDFCDNGTLIDFKSTVTRTYTSQRKGADYILQGSIYRWLFPEIVTEEHMQIIYIFMDWSAANAAKDANYPQFRIKPQNYTLLPLRETENYIIDKTNQLKKYWDKPEEEIPACSKEELWQDEPQYKYFKNPEGVRSTKNFDNYYEAYDRFIKDGSVGIVKTVEGEARACRYCAASTICNQAALLKSTGNLII